MEQQEKKIRLKNVDDQDLEAMAGGRGGKHKPPRMKDDPASYGTEGNDAWGKVGIGKGTGNAY